MPRSLKAYGRGGPGLTLWQSRDELARARRRMAWVTAGLAVLALLWLAAFADPTPEPDSDVTTGVIILEVFTVVPLAVAAWRTRRLTQLLRQVDTVSDADQEVAAEALRSREEAVWRVGRLVEGLEPGPVRDAAVDALAAGREANESRRRLQHRSLQLQQLLAVTKGTAARRRLNTALSACAKDLSDLDELVEGMAASVADLVDAANRDAADAHLAQVREATERVTAVAQAMRELEAT